MNGKPWTPAEDEILRQRYPHELTLDIARDLGRSLSSVYGRAERLELSKTTELRQATGRMSSTHPNTIASRFKPGLTAWNKGMKGLQTGGVETQFKKGHRNGRALENYQPIGAERISKDGYLERKTNDDMPLQKRWRAVHLLIWEAAHGPLPKGHAIRFKNGDKTDIQLSNLELLSRADNMRRNTIHRYPPELKDAIRTIGRIKRKLKPNQENEHEQHHQ